MLVVQKKEAELFLVLPVRNCLFVQNLICWVKLKFGCFQGITIGMNKSMSFLTANILLEYLCAFSLFPGSVCVRCGALPIQWSEHDGL